MVDLKVFWATFLVLAIMICSCDNKLTAPRDRSLRIAILSKVQNFDPVFALDLYSQKINSLSYRSLLKRRNGNIIGDLASGYSVEKGSRFVFHLKRDCSFSDGRSIDSKAVKKTFLHYQKNSPKFQSFFELINKIETPDDFTIIFNLSAPRIALLQRIFTHVKILSFEQENLTSAVSGPAILKNKHPLRYEYKIRKVCLSEKKSYYDKLFVRVIHDQNTQYLSVLNNEIDIATYNFSWQWVQRAHKKKKINIHYGEESKTQYLAFNLALKKFQKLEVRKSLANSLNIDKIIKHKLGSLATRAHSLIPPRNYYALKKSPSEKTVKDKTIKTKFTLLSSNNAHMNSIQQIFIQNWKEAGHQVELLTNEWGLFYSRLNKGDFEAFSLSWSNIIDPELLYRIFHSSKHIPKGQNRQKVNDSLLDTLLEAAETATNINKRKKLYLEIQKYLFEKKYLIPLWHYKSVLLSHQQVKNIDSQAVSSWIDLLQSTKK